MTDPQSPKPNARKQMSKRSWKAPQLLDLSLPNTAGAKDAIASTEGSRGRQGKIQFSPS